MSVDTLARRTDASEGVSMCTKGLHVMDEDNTGRRFRLDTGRDRIWCKACKRAGEKAWRTSLSDEKRLARNDRHNVLQAVREAARREEEEALAGLLDGAEGTAPGTWTRRAACRQSPLGAFLCVDMQDEDSMAEAKSYCGICPVRQQCLDWALAQPSFEGIAGEQLVLDGQVIG